MARPSQKTDEKLVQAALDLLPTTGYSGLKMRTVAAKAGVNLGMFHYHFKSKEAFIQRVASEFYEGFYETFTLEIETGSNPKEQLRKAVLTLVRFARDNRRLMLALGRDILEGEQQLVRMLESFLPRHGIILFNLIRDCQKQGLLLKIPLPMVIMFLIGSIAGPIFIMAVLEQVKLRQPFDIIKKVGIPFMLTDAVIEQRLNLAMRALEPGMPIEKTDPVLERKIEEAVNLICGNPGQTKRKTKPLKIKTAKAKAMRHKKSDT